MKFTILLELFSLLSLVTYVFAEKELTLNAIAFSVGGGTSLYYPIVTDFNNYAKEKGINTKIHLNLFTFDNATGVITDYESMLDSIFSRRNSKYDFIFYDSIFSPRYAPDLLDLKDIIPKETIDMYMTGIAKETCIIDDKIIALPTTVDYDVIYYNEELLNKYGKKVPKTWDQFIEIGEHIKNMENDPNLVIYNGLFGDSENGICSLYEFLYSYRKDIDSDFPEITSNEAVEALEKIKEMKERISSDTEFQEEDLYTFNTLQGGNYLFLKYWNMNGMPMKTTLLPGRKEGMSGSVIGGYNIGISKYSDIKKRNQVIEAFKFITSRDIQKKYYAMENYLASIPDLYEDPEVCGKVDCNYYKSIQLIGRPINTMKNYNSYTGKFVKYAYEYIYGDSSVKAIDVLKKIEDITKFYNLSLSTEDSNAGLILLIVITVTIVIMMSSLSFLYVKKFKPYFNYISNDLWFIFMLGLALILCSFYLEIGEISAAKCFLKIPLVLFGLTLNYIPILYKLIVFIPEDRNKFSVWVNLHRYKFLGIFIVIDAFLIGIMSIFTYSIETVYIEEGKNFKKCHQGHKLGDVIYYFLFFYKLLIFLISFLFIFMEWNVKILHREIRFITATLYMNVIIFITYVILSNTVIENTENYIFYSIGRLFVYYAYAITNFVFLYAYRLLGPMLYSTETDIYNNVNSFRSAVKNTYVTGKSDGNMTTPSGSANIYEKSSMTSKISNKILKCHYQTTLDSDTESANSNNNITSINGTSTNLKSINANSNSVINSSTDIHN